jgi:CO/xanthine dehydrogenase Mo-binding subunit
MIKFGDSGNAELYVMSGPSGQGHETVYPEIVAGILGIDPERLVLRPSDPAGPALAGGGTVGSRSTMMHGSALAVTAHEVVRKGLALAAGPGGGGGRRRVPARQVPREGHGSLGEPPRPRRHGAALMPRRA